jgi:hypothetical protein
MSESQRVTYRNKSDRPVDELLCPLAVPTDNSASFVRRRHGGFKYVKIKVVRVQSFKCLLKTFGDIGLVGVPQFAGDENVFARDATILDTLADFVLVS